jgi:hypothetical protein
MGRAGVAPDRLPTDFNELQQTLGRIVPHIGARRFP